MQVSPNKIFQFHIPKTGGSALRYALRMTGVKRYGHSVPLTQMQPGDRALVTVRDPVERFLSAYAWERPALLSRGYPDADHFARNLSDKGINDRVVFQRQVHWLESLERMQRPDIMWIGHTETLDADFERLRALLRLDESHQLPEVGNKARNVGRAHEELSPLALANVQDWYSDDILIVEAI